MPISHYLYYSMDSKLISRSRCSFYAINSLFFVLQISQLKGILLFVVGLYG